MTIWLDAHLSPAVAAWITTQFSIGAVAVRERGLRASKDREIFFAAREAKAIVMTKDSHFAWLVRKLGPPPQVIWLTFGNTSNVRLKEILERNLTQALAFIQAGESLVEINAE